MAQSTTSIAQLPQNVGNSHSIATPSMQTNKMIYEPAQQNPVSTQQISNEFYGNVSGQPQYTQGQGQGQSMSGDDQINYQPMNIHPNPYGSEQSASDGLPLPEASPQRNQQNYTVENIPQQTLPSRDIPINTLDYQQDNEIKPNHIPSVKLTSDDIRDYEKTNEDELK